jgi:hypothetical protein
MIPILVIKNKQLFFHLKLGMLLGFNIPRKIEKQESKLLLFL